ncbi:indolepyruvate oxidoreductase subunit beta [Anaerosolibacter sp.]|uniref:indolepyruvate oxidoreductase subunit beta n=1 Tax=Anaerosolibacter sp. TaxID=1872527 RepID=UPI0026180035|nr:indolepyruvate oxidoreductase subunit beta [Anaerosolibacter sp.]
MSRLITNIMLGGVGGQGLVLMTRIISQAALKAGYDVKSNDVVGLSQRGGMIWGNVRFGDKVYSPNIPPKEGDILVAMEPLEALRWTSELKDDGIIIMNTKRWYPMAVQQEKVNYPEEDIDNLKERYKVVEINTFEEAVKMGKKQISNVMLLGALAKQLSINTDIWKETIRDNVPRKYIDLNLEAFDYGYGFSG